MNIKFNNKVKFVKYIKDKYNIVVDLCFIFDV